MHNFSITIEGGSVSEALQEQLEKLGSLVRVRTLEASGQPASDTVLEFDSNAFRKDLHSLREAIALIASEYDAHFKAGEKTISASAITDIFDRVLRQEQQIIEERQRNDLRPDGWGYSALDAITRYLPEHREDLFYDAFWFQFGTFVSDGVWSVDKHQILAILKQQAEDKLLHLCPSFDFSVTEGIISRLPDSIDTNDNPNWSVWYAKVVEGSRVMRKPRGIIHKLTRISGRSADGSVSSSASEANSSADESTNKRKRNIPKVSFDEIGGIDGVISQVREVIELPLKNPDLFRHLGIKPHKGMMLYGEPGCGKTMVAKAIANEVEAHFISVKGPELINKYQGASEENLRKLFDEARDMQPAIIFFDEIDAVGQRRSDAETLRTDARFVNQLLSVMDGVEDYGRICVIGATNRIELIDPALLRPGRFDYQLEVKKPDAEGCRRIFEIVTKEMPLDEEIDRANFGRDLVGRTGAEISFIAREAAYNTLRRTLNTDKEFDKDKITSFDYSSMEISLDDLNAAKSKLTGGRTAKKKV
ncbi:MAG: AAA family ATPase [Balneolia bacterium]|nr:AAA family ATPase [Balneolia bacterium]